MGDRANIVIESKNRSGDPTPIFIYSHWDGLSGMFEKLQKAIRRRKRWNDESYLARIIFEEVIKNDIGSETGYGLSVSPPDNEHPYLCVDSDKQMIHLRPCVVNQEYSHNVSPIKSWTFEEFTTAIFERKW